MLSGSYFANSSCDVCGDDLLATPRKNTRKRCVECVAPRSYKSYKRSAEYQRRVNVKYKYGLTLEQLDEMTASRNGECDVCHIVPAERYSDSTDPRKHKLNIDHNHDTGENRGLLCHGCNIILGHARDDNDVLYSAIQYLTKEKHARIPSTI